MNTEQVNDVKCVGMYPDRHVTFHAYVIMCRLLNLVVVLGLYVIYYKSLSSYELNFCNEFFVSQFWIKLIELKVIDYRLILPQIYVFYVLNF